MKRLFASALLLAGLAAPAWAQRGGGHGSSSSPPPGSFNMGRPVRGFSGTPRSAAPRSTGSFSVNRVGPYRAQNVYGSTNLFGGTNFYRRRHAPPPSPGSRYAAGWNDWVAPNYLVYPDAFGNGDTGIAPDYGPEYGAGDEDAYGNGLADPGPGSADPNQVSGAYPATPYLAGNPYRPVPQPAQPAAVPEGASVTLIFKDGRAPEQIHNYLITRTTLFVRDQHPEEIPLDQLDLVATKRINHAAGADFQPPQ